MRHIKPRRWISVCGIGIAVTTAIIAAATTGSCVFGTTTNFCEQFGLHCKEGQECAAHQPVCIDIGGCGDGIVDRDKGEVCDDGNIIDGQMMDGKFILDDCSHDCMSDQRCGNNIVDVDETCDHGMRNGQPDDSCNDHCQLRDEFCGNGIVDMDMGEQCDPGEMDSAGCNSNQANLPANLLDPNSTAGCPAVVTVISTRYLPRATAQLPGLSHGPGSFHVSSIFLEARHDIGLLDTDPAGSGFKNRTSSIMLGLSFAVAGSPGSGAPSTSQTADLFSGRSISTR